MWVERFGTVNENIFFGFCAVVFLICVLVIACQVIRQCRRRNTIIVPGHSLTTASVVSSLLICISVLIRGVQPRWSSQNSMGNVCQLFVPFISLGYVLFGTSLFIKMWMIVISFRFDKITLEWVGNFVQWVFVVVTGTAVIIWIAAFTPNVFPVHTNTSNGDYNATTHGDLKPVYIYDCRGWTEDGSRDAEQFGWRVAMSCLMAMTVLIAVSAIPFYGCLQIVPDRIRTVAKVVVVSTLLSAINAVGCVVSGLIVWFQFTPQTASPNHNDSNKYAIIGSLQLWMLFFSVAATLVTEIIAMKAEDSTDDKHLRRSVSRTPSAGTTPTPSKKIKKKQSTMRQAVLNNDNDSVNVYATEIDDTIITRKSTYNETIRSGASMEMINDSLPENHQQEVGLPRNDDRSSVAGSSMATSVDGMSNRENDDNIVDYYSYQF